MQRLQNRRGCVADLVRQVTYGMDQTAGPGDRRGEVVGRGMGRDIESDGRRSGPIKNQDVPLVPAKRQPAPARLRPPDPPATVYPPFPTADALNGARTYLIRSPRALGTPWTT